MKTRFLLVLACAFTLLPASAQDFTSSDVVARREAFALLRQGEGVERALQALPSLRGPDKAAVVSALIASAAKPGVRPVLAAALDDESPLVRLAGIRAAVELADGDATGKLFALAAGKDEVARTAALALQTLKSGAADAWLRNVATAKDRTAADRGRAFMLLAARGGKDLMPLLLAPDAADAVSARVLRNVLTAADFGPALEQSMRLPAGTRELFIAALGGAICRFPDPERAGARKLVLQALDRATAEPDRLALIPLLGSLESTEAAVVLARLLDSPSVEVRRQAVSAVAKWNGSVARAPLEKALRDGDEAVRVLARRACDAHPAMGIRVLVLTGANNHDWKRTTPALVAALGACPILSVSVNEEAWALRPKDLSACDIVLFNWNTFGKDKREWSREMKAAFIPWVKAGGGVVIVHAGGSLFYDWKEFQSLIGGTWKDGTYHPRYQTLAVHIADPADPALAGLEDFTTSDEPWQRLTNGNPARKVLATVTTSKANGGTGNPEVAALVTELGKGRCFNLVLGHDPAAIGNPGFGRLLRNGVQWAAGLTPAR